MLGGVTLDRYADECLLSVKCSKQIITTQYRTDSSDRKSKENHQSATGSVQLHSPSKGTQKGAQELRQAQRDNGSMVKSVYGAIPSYIGYPHR